MRKETLKIATAFLRGVPAHAARTSTDGENVLLHGHCIAWKNESRSFNAYDVQFSFRNWPTATTRERINGVLDVLGYSCFGVSQRDGEQWLVYNAKKVRKLATTGIAFCTGELDEITYSPRRGK